MMMKLEDGMVYIKDPDVSQYTVIKGWGRLKWSRKYGIFSGYATLEILDRLAKLVKRLPAPIEAEQIRMRAVSDAVDKVRMDEDPKPFLAPPVKVKPFRHQVRAFDMALLVFGFVPPEAAKEGEE